VIRILQEPLYFSASVGTQLWYESTVVVLTHLLHDVGPLVGRQTFEYLRCACGIQLLDDGGSSSHGWLIEKLYRPIHREHLDDDRTFGQVELVDQLDHHVGDWLLGQEFTNSNDTLIVAAPNSFEQLIGWGQSVPPRGIGRKKRKENFSRFLRLTSWPS